MFFILFNVWSLSFWWYKYCIHHPMQKINMTADWISFSDLDRVYVSQNHIIWLFHCSPQLHPSKKSLVSGIAVILLSSVPKATENRSEDQLLNAQRSHLDGRGLLGHVGSSVQLILFHLTLISKRPLTSHSQSLGTCGIWGAVHQCSHGLMWASEVPKQSSKSQRRCFQECWGMSQPGHRSGSQHNATAVVRGANVTTEETPRLPKRLLIFCNKIFRWGCSCSVNSVVLTD